MVSTISVTLSYDRSFARDGKGIERKDMHGERAILDVLKLLLKPIIKL